MKKYVTRTFGLMLSLALVFSLTCLSAAAAQKPTIEPQYTGIASIVASLDINSLGKASCYGSVVIRSGYNVDLTVELQRDGDTIKTWTDSGSSDFSIDKSYYVTPDHDYQVVVTAEVYNSRGVLVDDPTVKSVIRSY